jgi:hypothetical protein
MHEAVLPRTDTVAVSSSVMVQSAESEDPSGARNQNVTFVIDEWVRVRVT